MNFDLTREQMDRADEIFFELVAAKTFLYIDDDPANDWDPSYLRRYLEIEYRLPQYKLSPDVAAAMAVYESTRTRFYYLVMDGRAADGTQAGFERASVYVSVDTLEKAIADLPEWPKDANIWRCDSENGPDVFLGRGG